MTTNAKLQVNELVEKGRVGFRIVAMTADRVAVVGFLRSEDGVLYETETQWLADGDTAEMGPLDFFFKVELS